MTKWLTDNEYLFTAVKAGQGKHLTHEQKNKLYEYAKQIQPNLNFTLDNCQSCNDSLVLFVYQNAEKCKESQTPEEKKQ